MNLIPHIHLNFIEIQFLAWLTKHAATPLGFDSLQWNDARDFFKYLTHKTDSFGAMQLGTGDLLALQAVKAHATPKVAEMIDGVFAKHLGSELKGVNQL